MAPEYAMHGQFSVKSDVFSFGVLALEIVSGQRNNCFRNGENVEDLLSYVSMINFSTSLFLWVQLHTYVGMYVRTFPPLIYDIVVMLPSILKLSNVSLLPLFFVRNSVKLYGKGGVQFLLSIVQLEFFLHIVLLFRGTLQLNHFCGMKSNISSYNSFLWYNICSLNYILQAWKNWREGTASHIIDPTLRHSSITEIMRCIHIGLLCVQESVTDRPTMAMIALMLNSYSITLPIPSQPAFFILNQTCHHNGSIIWRWQYQIIP